MRKRIVSFASALILVVMPGAAFASSRPAQAAQPAQNASQPKPKSQKEVDALRKVQAAAQANDPKATLAAIKEILENFTDTEYKPMLLGMAVQAAQQSGDYAETVVWGERAIQSDPNTILPRVLLAESIAANTHEHDLDKDQSVKKIQDYANKSLELLKTATSASAAIPEAEWPTYKQHLTSQSYDALGQAASLQKNYPEAIKNFQEAVTADATNPLPGARLTKAYVDSKQYDDAISTADKVLAIPSLPAQVKTYVEGQKNVATKLKAATAAPAAPAAPAPK
jgi:tetratricopeptide (TPR) repeat protein